MCICLGGNRPGRSQRISQYCSRIGKPVIPDVVPGPLRHALRQQLHYSMDEIKLRACPRLSLLNPLHEGIGKFLGERRLLFARGSWMQFPNDLDSRSPGERFYESGNSGSENLWMALV